MGGRLEGKVAIITGASSGIGRATALVLAKEGASVVLAARRERELAETAAAVRALGGRAEIRPTDVLREDDVASLVAFALAEHGRVDVGVNAAGGTFDFAPAHELAARTFRDWIDGHLTSAFLCTKHELAAMLETGGGSIVNVGTFVGHTRTFPGTSGYAAAKTGLIGLTRTVAAEYATQGIRANVLIVGGVDTPMFHLWGDTEEKRDAARGLHAMKRVARPEEIAAAALFLASDEGSFVTGAAVPVEGGVSLAAP